MTTHPVSHRATARDVAGRAGCSALTVSLVFTGNDTGRVSPQLRSPHLVPTCPAVILDAGGTAGRSPSSIST